MSLPHCAEFYGLRPTHDRVDLAGAVLMAPSFDTCGWFAPSPGVLRRVGGVLLDGARVDAPVDAVIVVTEAFDEVDPGIAAAVHGFLARAAHVLPRPQEKTVAPDSLDPWREAFRIIQAREAWESFGDFVRTEKPQLGPGIKERVAFASTVTVERGRCGAARHDGGTRRICARSFPPAR